MQRIILVAGGSGSIGGAIAEHFADQSDTVVVFGLSRERLQAVEKKGKGSIESVRVDVSKPSAVKQAVDSVVERFGRIDVLINAAGNMKPVTTTMPYSEAVATWDDMIAVNLTSCFLLAEAAAAHMTKPGGKIIFIGSVSAHTGSGRPGGMGYAAAKAGLSGLIFALAKELGPAGVTVNAVTPGLIADTGITSKYPEEAVQGYVQQTPLGRAGLPADIVPAVAYLASPGADFVTGQFIHVNGGLLLGRS